jgi:hypothetical protein
MNFNIIVQPFPIHYNCNDHHVMLYFKKHPEYESIEAMIKEHSDNSPYIRIIITRLDGSQVDHINDAEAVKALESKKIKREVLCTPIYYEHTKEDGKTHIILKFISFKNERVCFDFYAPKALEKHAHLIDPGAHSMHTSLPVMYPERTTLANPKSKIIINDVDYKVPVKVWIPLFFKGLKGYYSDLFNIGVLRAGVESINAVHVPESIRPGEKWVYKCGNSSKVYEIKSIQDSTLYLQNDNEAVAAQIGGGIYKVKNVSAFSPLKDGKKAEFSLEFASPLPVSPSTGCCQAAETDFIISINGHKSLITGKAKAETQDDSVKLSLVPTQPEWAVKRRVSTLIEKHDGEFILNTGIL